MIYLDPLADHGWKLGPNSHLFVRCGTPLEVLHTFAGRIGLRRAWFQHRPGRLPHYDVTASRRAAALRLGAIALPRDEAVALWREYRTAESEVSPRA